MNEAETRAVLTILTTAYDRQLPAGLDTIWAATLSDIPYGLARETALELVRTMSYLPRVADFRERARLIDNQHRRERAKRGQVHERDQLAIEAPARAVRARRGADMVRHVLGRLADAGQDTANGKFLGKERAVAVAEEAVAEWLHRTVNDQNR